MKNLVLVFALLLTLACCTTEADRNRMRAGLDSINIRNRNGQPFTVSDVHPYVAFFDEHGTPNDRLLAHYLLGLAYYDHGEAPMALQCYQDAAECADTTAADCDYAQLARVYGQMGVIYYQQNLISQQIGVIKKAVKYLQITGDTLNAMFIYEHLCAAYERVGNLDSAVSIIDSIVRWHDQHGYLKYSAIASGRKATLLVGKHEINEVGICMSKYERLSELFDHLGNIESGREIYYHTKGQYYLDKDNLDSAEYWFRKELKDGRDYNNQNAASKGLARLYEIKQIPDSAAKYYSYAYAMNDSIYAKMAIDEIERMAALYDYSRHQELAKKKSEEAADMTKKLWISISSLLLLCMIVCWLYIARKELISDLDKSLKDLESVRAEQQELMHDMTANKHVIAENNIKIKQLEKKLGRYGKIVYFGSDKAENNLRLSHNYQILKDRRGKDSKLTEAEWHIVRNLIDEYFPGCHDFLVTNLPVDSLKYKICLLLRLHFINKEVCAMIGYTAAYSSKLSSETYHDLFGKEGGSKELAAELAKLF